ncbi:protein of unknown function [Bradyrhizobium sp. ORS 285]|nr:exported hypothetical protein [Bradyrhizobium sp. ORS 285]SMX56507.1 protein of unknown function [Bradyrhizobium sp. ORS 285]
MIRGSRPYIEPNQTFKDSGARAMLFFFALSIAFAILGTTFAMSAWLSRQRSRNLIGVRPTHMSKRRAF